MVNHINSSATKIIAIDLPSGMFADTSSKDNAVVNATHTLTFQNYKLAFSLAENEHYCGEIHLMHIDLHQEFEATEQSIFELTDKAIIE
ncbi:MAG: hypothetical protein RIR31_638 [Bacteroidota bacterium]